MMDNYVVYRYIYSSHGFLRYTKRLCCCVEITMSWRKHHAGSIHCNLCFIITSCNAWSISWMSRCQLSPILIILRSTPTTDDAYNVCPPKHTISDHSNWTTLGSNTINNQYNQRLISFLFCWCFSFIRYFRWINNCSYSCRWCTTWYQCRSITINISCQCQSRIFSNLAHYKCNWSTIREMKMLFHVTETITAGAD